MVVAYLVGFVLFVAGILLAHPGLLKMAGTILLLAAVLYNLNVFKLLAHQPVKQ